MGITKEDWENNIKDKVEYTKGIFKYQLNYFANIITDYEL